MATKDRTSLKNDFANGKYATGEKFADLIDSMKVVQLPVVDPQALGTSLSFIDSISQDEDGKITATKKTLDLANAHELNPFKGWYKTGDTLPTDGFDGAYLYFKDTTQTPAVTTIYQWTGTEYEDTETVVDESNVNTFASNEKLNEVHIVNDLTTGGSTNVLSAEAGKELADTTTIMYESSNILNPETIKVGVMVRGNGTEASIGSGLADWIYGCTDYIELTNEGLVLNHGVGNKPNIDTDFCACLFSDNAGTVISGTHVLFASEQGGAISIKKSDYPTCNYVRFNLPVLPNDNTDFAVYRGLTLPEDDFVPYYVERKQKSINSLDSDDEYTPLSAKQGKRLKQMIDNPTESTLISVEADVVNGEDDTPIFESIRGRIYVKP